MPELPFYHVFNILGKMQRGEDITNDDIARLVGSPGYNMMKYLDHNLSKEVFARGNRYFNKVPFRERTVYEATNKAYSGRYRYRRSRKRRSYHTYMSRRYRR